MPDAVVEIVGLDALQRAFRATDRQMDKALHDGLQAAGLTVRKEAQDRVPYVTGKLSRAIRPGPVEGHGTAQSITVGIAPGGGSPSRGRSGGIGAATNPGGRRNEGDPQTYGPVVERGSGPRTIRARNGRSLMFTIGGETLFRRSVNHPGTRAHPFLVPALTENVDLISRRIFARVEAVLVGFGRTR